MDSGIFEEIDEEVKKENTIKFIKEHIKSIMTVLVVIVLVIASYSTYLSNQKKQAEIFTKRLVNVVYDYDGTLKSVERDLDHLIQNAPSKIANMAQMIKLGLRGDDISNELKEVYNNADYDVTLCDLAVLMFVSNSIEKIDPKEAIKMLEGITSAEHPFRLSAIELIGVISLKNNDLERAKDSFSTILNDKKAPKAMRNRIKLLNIH